MLYFTREKVSSVVQGFRRSLRENGWLMPSLTETTLINNPGFEGERFGDATCTASSRTCRNCLPFRSPHPSKPWKKWRKKRRRREDCGIRLPHSFPRAMIMLLSRLTDRSETPRAADLGPYTAAPTEITQHLRTQYLRKRRLRNPQLPAKRRLRMACTNMILEARKHADAGPSRRIGACRGE
jgi:hypothetical protein